MTSQDLKGHSEVARRRFLGLDAARAAAPWRRTLDANEVAQPMPCPLPRTGVNAIQQAALLVEVQPGWIR